MFNLIKFLSDEQKILSVIVGLLQTVRDGCVANEDLPNEIINLGQTLNCTKSYTDNSTKLDTLERDNAKLCEKLILRIGTDIELYTIMNKNTGV